jgi:mRNA interferase MazF
MPYSDFREFKGRPVLIFKILDKDDLLILPLTTNLQRDGIIITKDDLKKGSIKKPSVVIVPKLTAIDASLIHEKQFIAKLNTKSFNRILKELCVRFECQ